MAAFLAAVWNWCLWDAVKAAKPRPKMFVWVGFPSSCFLWSVFPAFGAGWPCLLETFGFAGERKRAVPVSRTTWWMVFLPVWRTREQISITLFFVITQEGKNHQLFKKIGQPVSFEQLPRVHGLVWWRRAFVKLKLTCGKMSPIIMWDELSWSFLTSLWKSVFCMMCWCKRDLLSMTCRQLRKSNPTRPQSRKLLSAQFQWLVVERQRPPANVS